MINNILITNKEIFEGYERMPKEDSFEESDEILIDWDSQFDIRSIKERQK